MGQQQLLLLVLATVIVGLATVAGIQAFEQGSTRANQDALTQTAVTIASDIQAKVEEPSQFGGYGGSISDASGDISLSDLGYQTDGSEYVTADGSCALESPDNLSKPSNAGSTNIVVTCESSDNEVGVWVDGTTSENVFTASVTLGS